MKNLFLPLLIISFILSFSLVYADIFDVVSYNDNTGLSTIHIKKGWNLIPLNGYSTGTTCNMDLLRKGTFVYSPTEGRYITESDIATVSRDKSGKYRYVSNGGGAFVYSNTQCDFITEIPKTNDNNKISSGWNFITIEPQMIGKKVKDVFNSQNCIVSKFAAWDSINQQWVVQDINSQNLQIGERLIQGPIIGAVYGVKFTNNCNLVSSSYIIPPSLPQ